MESTALRYDLSSELGATPGERAIEQCWRVIAAPDGRITICAVYEQLNGVLQLRIVRKPGQVVRVADVVNLEAARSLAAEWLIAGRQSGGFESYLHEA
jgi:hypothetical protein